mgnify:CR=1 FL=1
MRDPYREPVIIGIGELCEPVPVDLPSCASPLDLMVGATRLACEDTGMASAIIDSIDVVAVVRTFADSTPMYANPFGEVMNYPRAVARRIGANPDRAIYSQAGGNTPQALVNEFCDQIASGNDCLALLVGGEALANSKAALKANLQLDMGDDTEGQVSGTSGAGLNMAPMVYQDKVIIGAARDQVEPALQQMKLAVRAKDLDAIIIAIGNV